MRKHEVILCVVDPGRKLVFTAIIRRKDDIQKIRCCSKARVYYTGVKRITCQLEELKLGTDGIKVIETSLTAAKTINVKKKNECIRVCALKLACSNSMARKFTPLQLSSPMRKWPIYYKMGITMVFIIEPL